MTNISKAHQRFSNRLNEPRVLTEPQEFLGPNYEAVLDFWLFIDGLTKDQWKTIKSRYCDFRDNHESEWIEATDEAYKTSDETIGRKFSFNAAWAAEADYVNSDAYVAYWATYELIGNVPNKVFHKMFYEHYTVKTDEKLQQVIILRKDLTMRKGKMVAQGGHAVVTILMNHFNDGRIKQWYSTGQTKICVYIESEEELIKIYNEAQSKNMLCSLITDSGLTEFGGVPTITCCAIGPEFKTQLQPITGHLKLL